jgi:hypothetical protein
MPDIDHIYYNGVIITMDSRCSVVEAMAVNKKHIVAVGSNDELLCLKNQQTQLTDLNGRVMMPGFYDGHSHYLRAGYYKTFHVDVSSPPVGTTRNIDEIKQKLKEVAAHKQPGEWIMGFGYDDTAIEEKKRILAKDLDEVTTKHPIYLRHVSGHLCVANSFALKVCGITASTPNPTGGVIRRDIAGFPTGELEEPQAMALVIDRAPEPSTMDWLKAMESSGEEYTSRGVTTAHDGGVTTALWGNYFEAHRKGLLRNRVQLLPKESQFDFKICPYHISGTSLTEDAMLSLGALKMFSDGSLQAYTGYLSNPYHKVLFDFSDDHNWRGYLATERSDFIEKISLWHRRGWQIAVHANGDDAIQTVLDGFEVAQKGYPRTDARHILIHCQTVREDQLDRIKRLGVLPSFFVVHVYYWGDRHRDIFLGTERAARINPLRSALARGIPFTTHNDTYVTPINPLLSVWTAVNRLTSSGKILGENQTIPVVDALRSITTWGAYQFNEEAIKGSLEPGKLADMVVLDSNPITVPKESIKDIKILCTIIGNVVVWGEL